MNNTNHQETVKAATKDKFGRKQYLKSRVTPRYPMSAEREYVRVSNAYFRLISDALKEEMPGLMEAYQHELRADSYNEDAGMFLSTIGNKLLNVATTVQDKLTNFGLETMINKCARQTRAQAVREWKRVVKSTLGVDLMDEYYSDDFYREVESQWQSECKNAIDGILNNVLEQMRNILSDGRANHVPMSTLRQQIMAMYRQAKRSAAAASRNAITTLASKLMRQNQTDAGCDRYIWHTALDARVRDCHRTFEGKVFYWDYPPEDWHMTKSNGIVYTGKHYHPGEAFNCRCIAIPVFNKKTVDLPIRTTGEEGYYG